MSVQKKAIKKTSVGGLSVLLMLAGLSCGAFPVPEAHVWTIDPGVTHLTFDAQDAGVPTLVWEDVSAQGHPITNATLAGLRLGGRVLSGSRFELHPDRLGIWTYDFGYRAFPPGAAGMPADVVQDVFMTEYPWIKLQHDPVRSPGAELRTSYQLRMALSRREPELVYALDFGDFEAVALEVRPWGEHPEDDTGGSGTYRWMRDQEDYRLAVTVSTDAKGEHIVTEQEWDGPTLRSAPSRFSAILDLPGLSRFYVRLSLRQGSVMYLAGGGMQAWLRPSRDDWPSVASGANTLSYHENGQPPEGARQIRIAWNESLRWPGFDGNEAPLAFSATCHAERIPNRDIQTPLHAGGEVLRLSGDEDASGNWSMMLDVPPALRDWSNIKTVNITYRVPTWSGNVYTSARGGADEQEAGQVLTLSTAPLVYARATRDWQVASLSLQGAQEARRYVAKFGLRAWGGTWLLGNRKAGGPFCIEIASIDLVPFAPGEAHALHERAAREAAWRAAETNSPLLAALRAQPLPTGARREPTAVLARGIWGFPLRDTRFRDALDVRDIWELRERMLDDLKANHLNAIHVYADQVPIEAFGEFVKLAESKGIAIWGVFAYVRRAVLLAPEARDATWTRVLNQASRYFETYRDSPTILAWAIDEEPHAHALPLLVDARSRLRDIGAQPHIMIYNQAGVMQQDARNEPLPGGVAMDCYPFYRFRTVADRYLAYLQATREAANACGGAAWFVPQMHGTSKAWVAPDEAQMRFQVWSALAWGITGFFPWPYHDAKNDDMSNTPPFDYYAEEMRKVALLEPLLLDAVHEQTIRWQPDAGSAEFLIGRFRSQRDPLRRYVIMVNLDLAEARTVRPVGAGVKEGAVLVITDDSQPRAKRIDFDGRVVFAPGEGRLILYMEGGNDETDD